MANELALDESLIQDFLTESEELLEQLDQDLVAIETAPQDADLLNRIFRAFHTIKGTSGFMGFTQVVDLTHHAEDILNLMRKGEKKVTRNAMDVFLKVLDQLRRMLTDIRNRESKTYELGELLGSLKQLQQAQEDRPMLGEILVAEGGITRAERKEALNEAAKTSKPLGEVLVRQQIASPLQVSEALISKKLSPRATKRRVPCASMLSNSTRWSIWWENSCWNVTV